MAEDRFSQRYGDLLYGSYDCVDRIVLNAYHTLGYNPGGFRTWWRRLHGNDEQLDNAHYAEVRIMPTWSLYPLVVAGVGLARSA